MTFEALQRPDVQEKLTAFLQAYPEDLHAVAGLVMGYKMAAANAEALLVKDAPPELIAAFIAEEADKVQSFLDLAAREHDREQEEKRAL